MPRIRKCTICGKSFTSYNGKTVCCDICKEIRTKEANTKANKRRYLHQSNVPELKICPICGKGFMTVKNIYCSSICSNEARKINIRENNVNYYNEHRNLIIERVKLKKAKNENF